MSDPLKKYIQQAKHQFDVEQPDPDLFGKILSTLEQKNINPQPVKSNFKYTFQWMAVAASFVILVICGVFLVTKSNSSAELAVNNSEQNHSQSIADFSGTKNMNNQPSTQTSGELLNNKSNPATNIKRPASNDSQVALNGNKEIEFNKQQTEFTKKNHVINANANTKNNESWTAVAEDKVIIKETVQSVGIELNEKNLSVQENVVDKVTVEAKEKVSQPATLLPKGDLADVKPALEEQAISAEVRKDCCGDEAVSANQNLKGLIKKGFFNFLSKKAKKWSGDALSIENQGKKDETILALHFKNEKFEFSKAIHF